ncbi:hypothetical protein U91I_01702 [alpha proteobacterium U9-1i]|nr:hypothetical protein U91I_01702 [alpha proteobacterium U9-1i]
MKAGWRAGALVAGVAALAFAAVAAAVELRSGNDVQLNGTFSDLAFAAGDNVSLSLTTTDDLAAAGGEVAARDAIMDDVFLFGGDISFISSTARDLFAAGGEIDVLSGTIADDVVAAGGRVKLAREARVDGAVVVAGREITIEAPVGAGLRAAGGSISLNTNVNGDVYLDGGTIVIGPDTHITGTLTHRGRRVELAPDAQIDGQIVALTPRAEPDYKRLAQVAGWLALSVSLGFLLLGAVVALAMPRLMNETAAIARRRPLSMLGLGFLIFLLAPIIFLFLIVSVLGLALGFLLAAIYAVLWPLALAGAAYALGMLIRTRVRPLAAPTPGAGARLMWSAIGLVLLVLVGLIPFLGSLVWLLAFLVGLGAVSVEASRALARTPAA